jgi:hypothetical protein
LPKFKRYVDAELCIIVISPAVHALLLEREALLLKLEMVTETPGALGRAKGEVMSPAVLQFR